MRNEMVAHVWAAQSKPQGRSGNGNISFSGPVLYSYSTAIAELVTLADGRVVALLSVEQYSNTTAQHIGDARMAVRHLPRFEVRFLPSAAGRAPRVPYGECVHAANIEDYRQRIAALLARARRARSNGPWLTEQAESLAAEAVAYARAFGLPVPDAAEGIEGALAALAPVIAEARERQAQANARRAEEMARRAEERAKAEALAAEEREARLAEWKAGAAIYPPRTDTCAVRVAPHDSAVLETSWGAEVPLAAAVLVFRMADKARREGRAVDFARGEGPRIGPHFRLDRVDADGTIRAGCHVIRFEDAEPVARSLGILRDQIHAACAG